MISMFCKILFSSIIFSLLFCGIFGGEIQAQNNLVPNWSFEDITQCPHYFDYTDTTLTFALPWQNPTKGTPDVFSSCDTVIVPHETCSGNGTPCNGAGYQVPHTGNNYAGIYDWAPTAWTNAREYIQVKLTDTLIKTKKYCASFFASLAERSSYSTSRLGSLISKLPVSLSSAYVINASPQIQNSFNNYLSDTANWMEIKGIYIAAGGENYITIGNFFNDANTDTLFRGGPYASDENIYFYIDDVSLVEYTTAYAGTDTSICKGLKIPLGAATTFGASYTWSVLSGSANSIDSTNASQVLATPTITTTYVLQKQQCGISSYDTVTVYVKPTYTANAGADTTICIGDAASIGVNNCTNCTYTWQNIASPYTHMPVLNVYPLANTVYTLALQDSCFTTYSNVMVNIEYCQSPVVSVPNIFTPNADGINDSWQLVVSSGALSIINYQCTIYDRWGVKVFDSSPPLGITNSWDGHTTSGLSCSEGTYYYVISYTDAKTNELKNLKGFLELIR